MVTNGYFTILTPNTERLIKMKKFLKKRSSNEPSSSHKFGSNFPPHHTDFSNPSTSSHPIFQLQHQSELVDPQFNQMRHQLDTLAVENSKMKSALHTLTEENIRLQDEIRIEKEMENNPRMIVEPENSTDTGKMNEIQKLVQLITEENDHLSEQLNMEREHSRELRNAYEIQIQRLTEEFERIRVDNLRIEKELETVVLENDDLHLRVSMRRREENEKIFEDEIGMRSKFEACRTILNELRTKYKEELDRNGELLEKSMEEKRTLGLRLAQVETEFESVKKTQVILWESVRILETENTKLSELLETKEERMNKMESLFNELLSVARDMANSKTKGEKVWVENKQDMTNKLIKLEKKCQNLKEDNVRLKNFKQEAMSKLIEARKLLLLDT